MRWAWSSVCPSLCLFVCRQNAYNKIVGPLKFKMAKISHIKNRYDVIFLPWAVRFWWNLADWCRMTCDCVIRSKSKPEVKFRYGGWLFFLNWSSYNSDVDWAITTKFGLLIDIYLLKRDTSANPKPGVKLRLSVRHLENRYNYNIITLPKMVRCRWDSTAWCWMTCALQWYGRNQNRQ